MPPTGGFFLGCYMNKYAENIGVIAQEIWGDPNKRLSHGNELRFGSQGSKSVDTEKGTFYDHETGESGGFVDLFKLARPQINGNIADALENEFGMDKDPQFEKRERDVTTVYDYVGDHGVLEYQVVRTDFADGKKTFRQQRPDGQGGWIKNLKGIERIPYNLPAVIHHKERIVFVVEGEKAADKLNEIGLLATTNNGGSGQWGDEHAKWLKGRRVVVMPDNDEVGVKHGAKVVNTLVGVAKEVRLLDLSDQLPAKGDIVDWLNTGKTKDQLFALVKKSQLIEEQLADPGEIVEEKPEIFQTMKASELMAMPPIVFLVEGLLTKSGFAVMYGAPGCGKTFLALDLALSIASGIDFHGMATKQGAVLYIAGEGVGGLGKRINAWVDHRGNGINPDDLPFYVLPTAVNFASPVEVEKLSVTLQQLEERAGGFSLIVVDTVARALLGADENSATDMGRFVKACDRLKEEYQCALLGLHHSGKDAARGMRGSTALMGAVDTSLQITKDENSVVKIYNDKQKDAEPVDDLYFKMTQAETGTFGTQTSVYLEKEDAASFTSGSTLNEKQLKAMNCCRDAIENGVVNQSIAKDSFVYWLENEGGVHGDDEKAKKRRRMAWLRALNSLIDSGNLVSAHGGKELRFKDETIIGGAHGAH